MNTVYDWLATGVFAALVVLFLQRSTSGAAPRDATWQYLPPAIGCAITNYLGNEGQDFLAIGVMGAVIVYVALILQPFPLRRP